MVGDVPKEVIISKDVSCTYVGEIVFVGPVTIEGKTLIGAGRRGASFWVEVKNGMGELVKQPIKRMDFESLVYLPGAITTTYYEFVKKKKGFRFVIRRYYGLSSMILVTACFDSEQVAADFKLPKWIEDNLIIPLVEEVAA